MLLSSIPVSSYSQFQMGEYGMEIIREADLSDFNLKFHSEVYVGYTETTYVHKDGVFEVSIGEESCVNDFEVPNAWIHVYNREDRSCLASQKSIPVESELFKSLLTRLNSSLH